MGSHKDQLVLWPILFVTYILSQKRFNRIRWYRIQIYFSLPMIPRPLGLSIRKKIAISLTLYWHQQYVWLDKELSPFSSAHDMEFSLCPVEINGHRLNSISWADDLVLFSQTKDGLQICLNKLKSYCDRWQLTVNKEKTKCMVFSRGNAKMPDFEFDNSILENVTGIVFGN